MSALQAQTSGTGALMTVSVTDPSSAIIVGARVSLNNGATVNRTQVTDSTGTFTFALTLPPGTYKVTITAPGFKTADVPGITVNVSETWRYSGKRCQSANRQRKWR